MEHQHWHPWSEKDALETSLILTSGRREDPRMKNTNTCTRSSSNNRAGGSEKGILGTYWLHYVLRLTSTLTRLHASLEEAGIIGWTHVDTRIQRSTWAIRWRWRWRRGRRRCSAHRSTRHILIRCQLTDHVLQPTCVAIFRDECPANTTISLLALVAAIRFAGRLSWRRIHVVPIVVHCWTANTGGG